MGVGAGTGKIPQKWLPEVGAMEPGADPFRARAGKELYKNGFNEPGSQAFFRGSREPGAGEKRYRSPTLDKTQ